MFWGFDWQQVRITSCLGFVYSIIPIFVIYHTYVHVFVCIPGSRCTLGLRSFSTSIPQLSTWVLSWYLCYRPIPIPNPPTLGTRRKLLKFWYLLFWIFQYVWIQYSHLSPPSNGPRFRDKHTPIILRRTSRNRSGISVNSSGVMKPRKCIHQIRPVSRKKEIFNYRDQPYTLILLQ